MTARGRGAGLLIAVLLAATTARPAVARPPRCASVCRGAIAACVATGNRRHACRRSFLHRCRRNGPTACDVVPATTSTTLPRTTTTTLVATATTTTRTIPLPTTTSTSTVTTSSTTSTTRAVPAHSWTVDGPLQWTTSPPADVRAGDVVPFVLTVDVPGTSVEGRIASCTVDVPPEDCLDARTSGSQLRIEPATFVAPAGPVPFTGTVPDIGCFAAQDVYVVAEVTLVDGDGTRRGPFFTPIAPTHVDAEFAALIIASPTRLDLLASPGVASPPVQLVIQSTCGYLFEAHADVDWLSVQTVPGYSTVFSVTADPSSLDPAAAPFTATISFGVVGTSGTVVVPVTLAFAPLDLHWVTPPPAEVGSGQSFPLALAVDGDFAAARVALVAFEAGSTRPVALAFDHGAAVTGPPGVLVTNATRGDDCTGPLDAELRPQLWITGHDGVERGPVSFPPAPFTVTRSTVPQRFLSFISGLDRASDLHFRSVRGGLPMPRDVSLSLACRDRGPARVDWTASVDVPWLRLSDTTGTVTPAQSVVYPGTTVSVDPTGLDPAGGPYTGSLRIAGAGVDDLVLPVELDIDGDVDVAWTTAPERVASGESFPIALAVTGTFDRVEGRARDCDASVPPFCLFDFSSFAIDLTNAGFFAGPPGTFDFEGTRFANCFGITQSFFGATFTITRGGIETGPFYATPSPVLEPAATTYSVLPGRVTLRGIAGQNPLAATLRPLWICGGALDWTAQVDRPWMDLTSVAGRTGYRVRDTTVLVVDTSLLDPAGSPYDGTVTFGLAGSSATVASVPVRVSIVAP